MSFFAPLKIIQKQVISDQSARGTGSLKRNSVLKRNSFRAGVFSVPLFRLLLVSERPPGGISQIFRLVFAWRAFYIVKLSRCVVLSTGKSTSGKSLNVTFESPKLVVMGALLSETVSILGHFVF